MHCDDFRDRFLEGAALKGPLEEHLAACSGCRDEFAFVGTLRSDAPVPSNALRDRVLMSFPRRNRWTPLAWAASLLVAAGAGFAGGAMKPSAPESSRFTDDRVIMVVKGLKEHYHENVEVDYEDGKCRRIRIDRYLLDMECCGTMRDARQLAHERPGFIVAE